LSKVDTDRLEWCIDLRSDFRSSFSRIFNVAARNDLDLRNRPSIGPRLGRRDDRAVSLTERIRSSDHVHAGSRVQRHSLQKWSRGFPAQTLNLRTIFVFGLVMKADVNDRPGQGSGWGLSVCSSWQQGDLVRGRLSSREANGQPLSPDARMKEILTNAWPWRMPYSAPKNNISEIALVPCRHSSSPMRNALRMGRHSNESSQDVRFVRVSVINSVEDSIIVQGTIQEDRKPVPCWINIGSAKPNSNASNPTSRDSTLSEDQMRAEVRAGREQGDAVILHPRTRFMTASLFREGNGRRTFSRCGTLGCGTARVLIAGCRQSQKGRSKGICPI